MSNIEAIIRRCNEMKLRQYAEENASGYFVMTGKRLPVSQETYDGLKARGVKMDFYEVGE